MSGSSHDPYHGSLSKPLTRSSPGESQGNVFFQTGQVPAYNQYTPRSSPGRFELNAQALYNQWPTSPPPTSSYPNYETHVHESPYTYYSRTPPISGTQQDSRKLPRLATNTGAGWHTSSHFPISSNHTNAGYIRSPTACYHPAYEYPTSGQGHGYPYHDIHTQEYDDHAHVPSMNTPGHMTTYEGLDESRGHHHRPSSPHHKGSSQASPPSNSPTEESSTVKKKRKRADPAQLKVLNETYNRTAFPSTEERLELAKALDMSPRSVQIWFQNKRQSMRQTNRQTSNTSSSAQPYSMAGPDLVIDDLVEHSSMGYGGSMRTAEIFTSKHSPEVARSHPSQSTSSHRRRNQEEAVDPRKWSRGY